MMHLFVSLFPEMGLFWQLAGGKARKNAYDNFIEAISRLSKRRGLGGIL